MTAATLAAGVFAVGWIPVVVSWSGRLRAERAGDSAEESRATWNAVLAIVVHVTLAELAIRATAPDANATPRLVTGMLICLVGLAFWTLARQTLVGAHRLGNPAALVVHGPFAVVRHPLALGVVILALGPAVAAATPLTWAGFAAVVAALARRCMQDEVELHATFGHAYASYAETTRSRLIPYVW